MTTERTLKEQFDERFTGDYEIDSALLELQRVSQWLHKECQTLGDPRRAHALVERVAVHLAVEVLRRMQLAHGRDVLPKYVVQLQADIRSYLRAAEETNEPEPSPGPPDPTENLYA